MHITPIITPMDVKEELFELLGIDQSLMVKNMTINMTWNNRKNLFCDLEVSYEYYDHNNGRLYMNRLDMTKSTKPYSDKDIAQSIVDLLLTNHQECLNCIIDLDFCTGCPVTVMGTFLCTRGGFYVQGGDIMKIGNNQWVVDLKTKYRRYSSS